MIDFKAFLRSGHWPTLLAAFLYFDFFFVQTYDGVLAMGVLLGIAGASFGVALSLGSGWFPPRHEGLAMGIAGAGNPVKAFFLLCVVVAGVYGAATASKRILLVQAVPAAIGLLLLLAAW